jgi:hypothetical protein
MSHLELWVNNEPIILDAEGCRAILNSLEKAETMACFFGLGKNRPRPNKRYRSNFFKFILRDYTYTVPKAKWSALRAACHAVIELGSSQEFIVGYRGSVSLANAGETVVTYDGSKA